MQYNDSTKNHSYHLCIIPRTRNPLWRQTYIMTKKFSFALNSSASTLTLRIKIFFLALIGQYGEGYLTIKKRLCVLRGKAGYPSRGGADLFGAGQQMALVRRVLVAVAVVGARELHAAVFARMLLFFGVA